MNTRMDPRTRHNMINDAVSYGTPVQHRVRRRATSKVDEVKLSRRHGMFIDPNVAHATITRLSVQVSRPLPSLPPEAPTHQIQLSNADQEDDSSDSGSSWEFKAPARAKRYSESGATLRSAKCTPAKEIASRYYAGLSTPAVLSAEKQPKQGRHRTASSAGSDSDPLRAQRMEAALRDARREANFIIRYERKGPDEEVVCRREGCRDTLRNAESLIKHLQLHILIERIHTCRRCAISFDTKQEIETHICRRRSRINSLSGLGNPIRDTFSRVIGKVRG